VQALKVLPATASENNTDANIDDLAKRCASAMGDDFNTPILISVLFDAVKLINNIQDGRVAISVKQKDALQALVYGYFFEVLGLQLEDDASEETAGDADSLLDFLVQLRSDAKSNQDWNTADSIRKALSDLGVTIKDGKDGSTWNRD
jgi:cysteinyl-tRNA synthetase